MTTSTYAGTYKTRADANFLFAVELQSGVTGSFYTFDGELYAQCVIEAKAVARSVANAIIDSANNRASRLKFVGLVVKPILEVVVPCSISE